MRTRTARIERAGAATRRGGAMHGLARFVENPSMLLRILASSAPAKSMNARTRAE